MKERSPRVRSVAWSNRRAFAPALVFAPKGPDGGAR
jgi:hypothetical protein